MTITQVRKAVTAVVGAVLSAVSLGLIPDPASKWVSIVVALLTAVGVYAVPNEPAAA